MNFETRFDTTKPVIGMVHLRPLPGSPQAAADAATVMDQVVTSATTDTRALAAGGVDAIMVENFGDVPFYPDDVPKHTVATMTRAATAVADATELPIGINVLRNDAEAAVSVAAAVEAAFVRVNVHTGTRVTDQGVVSGRAAQTLRLRNELDVEVGIFADIDVKHSAPLAGGVTDSSSIGDLTTRGLADAIIVSGRGTGEPAAEDLLRSKVAARDAANLDVPILVGSGVRPETVTETLQIADGVIVGTALKRNGETTGPVAVDRVRDLVSRAAAARTGDDSSADGD